MDAAYPIGHAAYSYGGSFLGRNVVAVNSTSLAGAGNLTTGQRLYFTYTNATNQQSGTVCLAYDPAKPAVTHLVLSNVSTTPCATTR